MVVQRCGDRGVSIFRFNSEDFPSAVGLNVDPLRPEMATLLLGDGGAVAIGRVRGIWLRRPQWPVIRPEVTDEGDRMLAIQESVASIGGLWRLLGKRCVSAPDALQSARWKLPQLQLAASVGFRVPRTIVTTAAKSAECFLRGGDAVLKAVQDMAVQVDGVVRYGFVQSASTADLNGATASPLLLQQRIAKTADWRVTVRNLSSALRHLFSDITEQSPQQQAG